MMTSCQPYPIELQHTAPVLVKNLSPLSVDGRHCQFPPPLCSTLSRFLLSRSFLHGDSPRLRLPIRDFLPLFLSTMLSILVKAPEAKFLQNKIAEIVFWHMHKFGPEKAAGDGSGVAAHPLMTTLTMTIAESDKVFFVEI